MHILAISGSLNEESSNSALLRALRAATNGVDVTLWDELGDLPHFRPDLDGDAHVQSLRRAVARADAILVATPEYAGGMPGALKNALDWLVGSGELYGKPLVVMSVAPSAERGQNARRWVAEVVAMQGGIVRESFTVALKPSASDTDVAKTAGSALERALAALNGER